MLYNQTVNEWEEVVYVPTTLGKILLVVVILALLGLSLAFMKKHSKKLTIKQLTFCAMSLALGTVLSNVKLFHFPTGGSITLLSMLVICLPGYWFGLGVGVLTGISYGLLQLLIDPYVLYPMQLVIDYVLAFAALGLSGLFSTEGEDKKSKIKTWTIGILISYVFAMLSGIFLMARRIMPIESKINYGILFSLLFFLMYVLTIIINFIIKNSLVKGYMLAVVGRYAFAVLSGWIFFGSYAWEGWDALPYSLVYNAIYIFTEAAVTLCILLLPPVKKVMGQLKTMATT